jgi:RNA polymerase sigma factor (sigma-70 family)
VSLRKSASVSHPLDDAEVMTQVRDGRLEMLAVLFERHHVKLFNFFLRLTRSRERSEDLVQEVFLRVLKYRHAYRSGAAFAPWLYQIARNAHLTELRQSRRDLPLEDVLDQAPDPAESPAAVVERKQNEDLLRLALDRLRRREILLLSRHEELKYRDLATLFECSVGALKVEVHRAVKDLRKAFLELEGGPA